MKPQAEQDAPLSAAGLEARMLTIRSELARDLGSSERLRLARELRDVSKQWSSALAPMDRVRLARNPSRPQTLDYASLLIRDFIEIHGDRRFADDPAIVAGLGYFGTRPVAIVGHQRGHSTSERLRRNFGKPYPEGYRKAARLYLLAHRFGLPLITFVDTQGAEPGVGAEERGQAEAIAANLELMARLETPVITCIIGEGGSGGALALAVANVVLIQENACYSVITPEGCAAILFRSAGPEKVDDVARVLRLSAADLKALGVVDEIVTEPAGGAHMDPQAAARELGAVLRRSLARMDRMTPQALRRSREAKFAAMGTTYLVDNCLENRRPPG